MITLLPQNKIITYSDCVINNLLSFEAFLNNLRVFTLKEHRSVEYRLQQRMLQLFLFPDFIFSSYFLLSVQHIKIKLAVIYEPVI